MEEVLEWAFVGSCRRGGFDRAVWCCSDFLGGGGVGGCFCGRRVLQGIRGSTKLRKFSSRCLLFVVEKRS